MEQGYGRIAKTQNEIPRGKHFSVQCRVGKKRRGGAAVLTQNLRCLLEVPEQKSPKGLRSPEILKVRTSK